MDASLVVHETLSFERELPSSVVRVWRAFEDSSTRARWGSPRGEEQVCSHDDVRSGGTAAYQCGSPGELQFRGEVVYLDVVPAARVIHTDAVWAADQLLATALLTWEFWEGHAGVRLRLTDQVASLVGRDMIDGHRNGHTEALDQLAEFLAEG